MLKVKSSSQSTKCTGGKYACKTPEKHVPKTPIIRFYEKTEVI